MEKKYHYIPKGTCSREIYFTIDDGILKNVSYVGGCNGNLQGVGRLVEGMPVEEVLARLSGIRCGSKSTSCPDQLTKAIREAMAEKAE